MYIYLFIILIIIFIYYYLSNKENFKYSEIFLNNLQLNENIKILKIQKSINYNNKLIRSRVGSNILYNIFNKLNGKYYTIIRYPDFINEIKRHSFNNLHNYFKFLKKNIIKKNINYIFDFTGYHGVFDNKVRLWIKLKNKYGRNTANKIMGTTHLIPNDKTLFFKNFSNKSKYIMKNSFGGARTGLTITNDKNEIANIFNTCKIDPEKCIDAACHRKTKYNIIQNFIEPSFFVNGHKFGLRLFLILIYKNNKLESFIYKDGFCYYTLQKYQKNSMHLDKNIVPTTKRLNDFIIENKLPYTYIEFAKYIKKIDKNYLKKFNNLENILKEYCKKIVESNKDDIYEFYNNENVNNFSIYAMDIDIDKDFKPSIFESNYYFAYTKSLRKDVFINMYNDIFYKLGLSNKEVNGMMYF